MTNTEAARLIVSLYGIAKQYGYSNTEVQMGDRNEIKLIGVPDEIEIRPDIGADDETVAFCFDKVDQFTFKAKVPPEAIAIMLGAVRIVRCKNCKHYGKFNEGEGDAGYGWCDSHNICVHDYFFCADGERSGEEMGGDT